MTLTLTEWSLPIYVMAPKISETNFKKWSWLLDIIYDLASEVLNEYHFRGSDVLDESWPPRMCWTKVPIIGCVAQIQHGLIVLERKISTFYVLDDRQLVGSYVLESTDLDRMRGTLELNRTFTLTNHPEHPKYTIE